MRRLSVPRASTAVAVVASIVAVLAVMFPGLGFGQPTTSHGGSPTDVFMTTDPGVCSGEDPIRTDTNVLSAEISVGQQSHVLTYFTAKWSWGRTVPDDGVEVFWTHQMGDETSPPDGFTWHASRGHQTATTMWAFEDIAPGDYTVQVVAGVAVNMGRLAAGQGVTLQGCELTVFVIPVAG